tara:strand:+ start:1079 stop:1330 length:252 start_codon:yes stop_codon:yes gene_type:complete
MIIYVKSDNEFELWDLIHLNHDHIQSNWKTIKIPNENEGDDVEVETLQLEIKTDTEDDKYDKRRKYDKLFDTLKLAIKLGVVK